MTTQQGLITSAFGRHYQLEKADGSRLLAYPRGKRSEAVVGDRVEWKQSQDEAVIERILPRKNLFYRQDEVRTKAFAANIDQILMMFAAEPEFSNRQLNRTLIAAEAQGIKTIVLLNKADLKDAFDRALLRLAPYTQMGYAVIKTSMLDPMSIAELQPLLQNKITLVLGPSGVGKSTLINAIIPDAQVQTQELSKALKTGKHTTTTSQLYWLPQHAGGVIDSPGFQEFGLNHIDTTQFATLMPDLRAHIPQCRFYNCTHLHEPGCGVIAAVQAQQIDAARYQFYQNTMQELLNAPPKY